MMNNERIVHGTPSPMTINNYMIPQDPLRGSNSTGNYSFQCAAQPESRYINPPSYEEAVKGTIYELNAGINLTPAQTYSVHNLPDQGQFGSSESYLYHHDYYADDSDIQSVPKAKKCMSYMTLSLLIVCFGILTIRFLFSRSK